MSRNGTATDSALIVGSRKDPELFVGIFDRHYRTLHRYLARRVNHALADELASEVFARAFRTRSSYDPTAERAVPWLFGIAAHLLARHWRDENRHLRVLAQAGAGAGRNEGFEDAADARLDASITARRLVEALEQLDRRDREVLLLYAWGELSYAEIAIAVGVPVGTVRSRLNRARSHLREATGTLGEAATTHREEGAPHA